MNWAQFKDPVSHMCLTGAVVASWSLTEEVSKASNNIYVIFSITEISKFSEII